MSDGADTTEQAAAKARGAWRQAMRLATDSVDGDETPVEVVWGNPGLHREQ
jgi:hypothetical protein